MNIFEIILLLPLMCLQPKTETEWELIKSEEHSFQIELPCTPNPEEEIKTSIIGNYNNYSLACIANNKEEIDSNSSYFIGCTTYPEEFDFLEGKEFLENHYRTSIDVVVKKVNGRLLYAREIFMDSIEGRQVKILVNQENIGGKKVIRMRMFLVKNKYYVLQTFTSPKNDNNIYIDKFMDSFQLLSSKNKNNRKFPVDLIKVESLDFEITKKIKNVQDSELILKLKLSPFLFEEKLITEELEFIAFCNKDLEKKIYNEGHKFDIDQIENSSIYIQFVHNLIDLKSLKILKNKQYEIYEMTLFFNFELEKTGFKNETILLRFERKK